MGFLEAMNSKDHQRLTNDWQSETIISETYSKYLEHILQVLTELSSIWHEHFVQINIAKLRVELRPNSNPVHWAP